MLGQMKRAPRKAEFHEGPKALENFMQAVKKVVSLPKSKVLELEKEARRAKKR